MKFPVGVKAPLWNNIPNSKMDHKESPASVNTGLIITNPPLTQKVQKVFNRFEVYQSPLNRETSRPEDNYD